MSAARTLFGFALAFLLAFGVDFLARAFNLLSGYPWGVSAHQNIQFAGIVLGAALGSHLVWLVPSRPWYVAIGTLLVVLVAAVVGAVLGRMFGPGVEQGFWWSKTSTDSTVHILAAALSVTVAAALGILTRNQPKSRDRSTGRGVFWEEREA